MTDIDIGVGAAVRSYTFDCNYTYINKTNPANATGTITSAELYCVSELKDVEVATFYVVSGNNLSTRDSAYIGTVAGGSKQTFSELSIDVHIGDYFGIYSGSQSGTYYIDISGGDGAWYISGDQIPCENLEFGFLDSRLFSLYGTGTTEVGEEANAIFMGSNF